MFLFFRLRAPYETFAVGEEENRDPQEGQKFIALLLP